MAAHLLVDVGLRFRFRLLFQDLKFPFGVTVCMGDGRYAHV